MERWPREAARWRLELALPVTEWSGLCRRWGCELRMRRTSDGSLRWMARRRRIEGSILDGIGCQLVVRGADGEGRVAHISIVLLARMVVGERT